jgi:hypothetical protein
MAPLDATCCPGGSCKLIRSPRTINHTADLPAFSQTPHLGITAALVATTAPMEKPAAAAHPQMARAPFLRFPRQTRQRALQASQSPVSCRYHRRVDTSHTPSPSTSFLYYPKIYLERPLTIRSQLLLAILLHLHSIPITQHRNFQHRDHNYNS